MELLRWGDFSTTNLALEFGTAKAGQREVSIIGVCNASMEVPKGNRHHVPLINSPKLCVPVCQRAFHLLALGNVDVADRYTSVVRRQWIDIHQKPPVSAPLLVIRHHQ